MKLEYKILWFEDNQSWFNSTRDIIQDFLDEHGFEIYTKRYDNDKFDISQVVDDEDFDLILMDFGLVGTSGDKIIEIIRGHQIYTEIVFYSQKGAQELRDLLSSKGVDGIYYTSRETYEFEEKLTKVIKTTIKKVQDVNNMRGMVMAETSELDTKMLHIISGYLNELHDEERQQFESSLFKIALDSIGNNDKKVRRFQSEGNILGLINYPVFDSEKKRIAVSRIIEAESKKSLCVSEECMQDYKVEILGIRNVLAHVKEEFGADGKKVLRSLVKGYEAIMFNDELCVKIRKDIKKHSNTLEKIHNHIEAYKKTYHEAVITKEDV